MYFILGFVLGSLVSFGVYKLHLYLAPDDLPKTRCANCEVLEGMLTDENR